jgi:50S ribosomal protein L16 3-hydroxylase
VLEPGDMLYLPPNYAHDGIAEGECMTWSIGFRSPQAGELARELLIGLSQLADDACDDRLYRDPRQPACDRPAQIPAALQAYASDALQRVLSQPDALSMLLGEWLSTPKAQVWFDGEPFALDDRQGARLDRRTRMLYDERHLFINGEAFRVAGRDASRLRELADRRSLAPKALAQLSPAARAALQQWADQGWLCNGAESVQKV